MLIEIFAWHDVSRSENEKKMIILRVFFFDFKTLTNIFSNERFANQQFRKTGINRCRSGGHRICVVVNV